MKEVGEVSILVNNAGIMPQHEVLKHSEGEIRKIYEINTIAHYWMFQAFLPKMMEKNQGHIVALSSIAGLVGLNNVVPYCGSKVCRNFQLLNWKIIFLLPQFAVRGTMEALAEELRSHTNGKSKVSQRPTLFLNVFWSCQNVLYKTIFRMAQFINHWTHFSILDQVHDSLSLHGWHRAV